MRLVLNTGGAQINVRGRDKRSGARAGGRCVALLCCFLLSLAIVGQRASFARRDLEEGTPYVFCLIGMGCPLGASSMTTEPNNRATL